MKRTPAERSEVQRASAATPQARCRLDRYDNRWYDPGRSLPVRMLWVLLNRVLFQTTVPWPSAVKSSVLRVFGAKVGKGVVFKQRVNIKYPWNLSIGSHSWIGEGVWIDSLDRVRIGAHVCLSQECMVETGNHDWSRFAFDLKLGEVIIEDGAWAAVRSLLLPGSRLASHAVLGAGSVLSGETEAYGIYVGNPAQKIKMRSISATSD